ncbi:MAG TPA: uracil-DNA glycosylase [Candidatus Paceibacterota bacterium]|nr:uracil-DNA glycosylase [Candidatus Paceibacterota bacterium]
MADKQRELAALEAEMAADAALPLRDSANLVFGEGNLDCAVMLIGEAPGQNEDRLRRPFVGRGGQLLDKMIASIGWKRADVYITNIVKRRPPENRDPLPSEIEAYQPYLTRQIAIVAPKVIVTLGRFSMNYFLPEAKITRDHGRVLRVGGRVIFPVYHPAAALRSTEMMNTLAADFRKIPDVVSGKFAENLVTAPAMKEAPAKAKPEKPKQQGLF